MSLERSAAFATNGNYGMSAVELVPERVFALAYNSVTPYDLSSNGTHWQVDVDDDVSAVPRASDALRITHIGDDPPRRVYDKYTTVLPADIRGNLDVVIDVGAFIGEFTRALERRGIVVYPIEPDPLAAECCQENVEGAVHEVAAWYRDDTVSFSMGRDPSESSVLTPDSGGVRDVESRPARSVTSLAKEWVVDPDLVKIEAEGAEPEVVAGAVELSAPIVIDVSRERNGDSPRSACEALLQSHGYTTTYDADHDVLFGRPGEVGKA